MKASAHELIPIRDFARKEGLGFRYDAIISPRIDGGRKPLAQRLSPAEVAEHRGRRRRSRRAPSPTYCRTHIGKYAGRRSQVPVRRRAQHASSSIPTARCTCASCRAAPAGTCCATGSPKASASPFAAIREEKRERDGAAAARARRAASAPTASAWRSSKRARPIARRPVLLQRHRRARRALRRRQPTDARTASTSCDSEESMDNVKNETVRESLRAADGRGHAAATPRSSCSPAASRPTSGPRRPRVARSAANAPAWPRHSAVLIHTIGGIAIALDGDFPRADVAASAEPAEFACASPPRAPTAPSPARARTRSIRTAGARSSTATPSACAPRIPRRTPTGSDAPRAVARLARRALPLRRRRVALPVPLSDRSAAHDSHARRRRRRAHARGVDRRARRRAARRRAVGRRQDDDVARRRRARRARALRRAHGACARRRRATAAGWSAARRGRATAASPRTARCRCAALILLEQADRDELVPLSPARALAMLYRCHFPPLWDARAGERTLDNLERARARAPRVPLSQPQGPRSGAASARARRRRRRERRARAVAARARRRRAAARGPHRRPAGDRQPACARCSPPAAPSASRPATAADVRPGDVVLVDAGGRLVCHRLVYATAGRIVTRGDNCPAATPAPLDALSAASTSPHPPTPSTAPSAPCSASNRATSPMNNQEWRDETSQ